MYSKSRDASPQSPAVSSEKQTSLGKIKACNREISLGIDTDKLQIWISR